MNYTEAFRALGYSLSAPRTDWSATNDDGVCLSLWSSELAMSDKIPWFNTRVHGRPLAEWGYKPGNKLRIEHLQLAAAKFDGFIDVILVSGTPGGSYETASPWHPAQRRGARWRITEHDPETGHFAVAVVPT